MFVAVQVSPVICPAIVSGRDDRDVAGGIEAPEARVDQEQADRHQPDIVRRDVARRPVGPEFADARTEHDEEGKCRAAGDGVNNAGSIGVMIAPQLHHPARGCQPQAASRIHMTEPISTAMIQNAPERARSMIAPEMIEAVVIENSRKAPQNTPLRRCQSAARPA